MRLSASLPTAGRAFRPILWSRIVWRVWCASVPVCQCQRTLFCRVCKPRYGSPACVCPSSCGKGGERGEGDFALAESLLDREFCAHKARARLGAPGSRVLGRGGEACDLGVHEAPSEGLHFLRRAVASISCASRSNTVSAHLPLDTVNHLCNVLQRHLPGHRLQRTVHLRRRSSEPMRGSHNGRCPTP